MIIDANMYWLPEELFQNTGFLDQFMACINKDPDRRGLVRELENEKREIVIEKPKGYANLNYVQGEYQLDIMLRDMEEAGVDKAVLKVPCAQEWLSLELCKKFNNGMADHVKRGEGHFSALAVVPPLEGQESVDELKRCVEDLGMTGVQMCAHYGDKYLDHPDFRPFLKEVNRLKLPVYVHHTPVPVEYDSIYEYNNLRRSYGRCADQIIAISREIYSGIFNELPDLKMVHSMLGGAFFAYKDSMFRKKPGGGQDTVKRFDVDTDRMCQQLNDNIYFELSHAQPWGNVLLEAAVKILGADHIIYGSSYPVRKEWMTEGADFVQKLDITETEKQMILHGNAEQIYKLNI